MPKKIDWRELAFAVAKDDGNGLLDSRWSARITKANTGACTVCTDSSRHTIKYQLLRCKSESCKNACPQLNCGWCGKVLTCTVTTKKTLYEAGNHFVEVRSPRKAGLTRQQKKYCQGLTAQRMKPVCVRNAIRAKFGLEEDKVPRLRAVQNFVNYYAKAQLGYNDDHEGIMKAVRSMAYDGNNDESAPIIFTYGRTTDGQLVVGDGSEEEPYVVGITTRKLLACLDRDPASLIFHTDATFKLSQVGYPVLVLGMSDRLRKFHLVAFCIISQRIESVYAMALYSFRSIYGDVTGKQLRLKFVMGDAEDGQLNALEHVFRYDSNFIFLMCFFHVMKKVQEQTKSLPNRVANCGLAQIYDMNFCSTLQS